MPAVIWARHAEALHQTLTLVRSYAYSFLVFRSRSAARVAEVRLGISQASLVTALHPHPLPPASSHAPRSHFNPIRSRSASRLALHHADPARQARPRVRDGFPARSGTFPCLPRSLSCIPPCSAPIPLYCGRLTTSGSHFSLIRWVLTAVLGGMAISGHVGDGMAGWRRD